MLSLKALILGLASLVRRLPNFYNPQGGNTDNRPTTANIDCDGSGSVIHFLSTSSMTEGRPDKDGSILHFNWDGTSHRWASQLFLGHSTKAGIKQRYQQGTNGLWSPWADVFYYPEPISDNDDLNDDKYTQSGDYYCKSDATATTLVNCPSAAAFWIYVRNGIGPDSIDGVNYKYRTQILLTRYGKQYMRYCNTSDGGTTWAWSTWGSLDDKKVNRSGDTMTGNLSVAKSNPYITSDGSSGTAAAQVYAKSDIANGGIVTQGSSATTPAMGLYDSTHSHWIVQHTIENEKTFIQNLSTNRSSSSVTWASAVSSFTKNCRLVKVGRLVFINFGCSISTANNYIPTNNSTICTLPAEYRPAANTTVPAIFCRATSSGGFAMTLVGTVTITTAGVIQQNYSGASNAIYFSAVFETGNVN